MRLRRRAAPEEEPPRQQASVEEPDELLPPVERRSPTVAPETGPWSAAERAAARRRLDSLAEEF
jgi:hypothetical protein